MWNDSPPVSLRRRDPVDPAEAQRLVADVELGQAGRLVRTTMSRSVRDWKVPPRPMSSTASSIRSASPRMSSRPR